MILTAFALRIRFVYLKGGAGGGGWCVDVIIGFCLSAMAHVISVGGE